MKGRERKEEDECRGTRLVRMRYVDKERIERKGEGESDQATEH
jgi:hypothetical protein